MLSTELDRGSVILRASYEI